MADTTGLMPALPLAPVAVAADLVGAVLGATGVDTSDCELVRSSFPTQPVNTWSSLAYCIAGVWVLAVAGRSAIDAATARAAGALFVLAGVGSFAYHGLGGELSGWLHDASFLWALAFMAICEGVARPSPRFRQLIVFGAAALGAAATFSVLTNLLLVVLVGWIVWVQLERWPARPAFERRTLVAVGGVLVVAGAAYLLGRSGGPLCDPDTATQTHGLWHVLTAVALAGWARVAFALYPTVDATGGRRAQ
jgi:hypothetical protein